MKKKLSREEKLKKINDDPVLWLRNFVKITTNTGEYVPFVVNDQQKLFIDEMVRFNIIAKARQIGFSTMSIALCLWMACTRPRTNYLIVSYKQDSATSLFDKLKMMYADLPHDKFKFPKDDQNNRNQLRLDNGSSITLSVAGGKDVGRGTTYEYILLSEFAFYENQDSILLSAEQALAKSKTSKLVIETTSNGFNPYQKLFMNAYDEKSKYKAFFFPFYSSSYAKQFKDDYDEAEVWYKADNKGNRLTKDDLEKDELYLLEQGASLKQLMWRRWKLLDMSLQQFYQEFPATPMESFISSGLNVFDQGKIVERLKYIKKPLLYKDVKVIIPDSIAKYIGKSLMIYELPKQGVRYYAGVDTASGSGGDYSTISILNADGEQVASFYDNKIPVYEFAKLLDIIGKFYNYAFLTVERNSFGTPILERLRKEYEYMNMYKHKVFNQQLGKKQLQLGYQTTQVTKNIMITDLKEQFELEMILINCDKTLKEMQIFIETDGKTGNKKGNDKHDDCVIAMALAIQGIKQNKWYV
ncbi:DNA packaging protein [Bacillus pseudomycoides]|uniref:terminase large subunit domain-containing protein n=1 Tax=Bacillus pseudomycoides TaxID=64104 RepID=UPI000BF8EBCD|nr:terminase family protein [Bacillus pseudomycoides]PEP74098.1 DNA packaging protein [Bacillus pseudomycoides]PFW91331.1 DNA packaging protein [Bacillus pseudomycoides]PFX46028.1 DNA packaging protein [Bacillus pseudomycoides]